MQNCIFCKIINKELPSQVLYESEQVLAFRDIHPEAPVHVLIVPKKHISSVNEVTLDDREALGELFIAAQEIALKEGISETGYRLITNTGKDAGQLVDHLHLHLLGGKSLGHKLVKD